MNDGTSVAKCSKPGCGAQAIKGRPCLDFDCPQQFVRSAAYATLAAENAALKALVAEMVEGLMEISARDDEYDLESDGFYEGPYARIARALITRAKEATS